MTTYSKPAKALAVLTFTSGVITDEKAVELFDLITQAEDEAAIGAILNEHDFSRWDEVWHMNMLDWSEEINTLAMNYDRLAKEMAEPVPAPVAAPTETTVSDKYLKSGGYECPHCGERDVVATGPLDPDHMTAYQEIKCVACKATWCDVWSLVGCDNIVTNDVTKTD